MTHYSILGACEPKFDFRNAIHDHLGCPEASRGKNRGQNQPKTTFAMISGKYFIFSKNAPRNGFYGLK